MRRGRVLTVVVAAGAAAAFVLLGLSGAFVAPAATGHLAPITVAAVPSYPTPIRHVFVLMFENAEFGDVMRNGSYERYLASHYALAGQYYAVEHYSLPNYLAVTSGTVSNLFKVEKATNVGDLVGNAGETWRGEEESMPYPCDSVDGAPYDLEHNPWVMYADLVKQPARCDQHVVNFTALNASIATGKFPNYSLIVPNRIHDGHDTNVSVADSWLRGFLTPLVNSTIFRSSVFLLTYDEGTSNLGVNNSTGGGHVYFVAVSPFAVHGLNSTVPYTDFNVLTTTEWLLGLGHTGHNDSWSTYPPMYSLFSFPTKSGVTGSAALATAPPTPGDRASSQEVRRIV